jgi:hypothetical protein
MAPTAGVSFTSKPIAAALAAQFPASLKCPSIIRFMKWNGAVNVPARSLIFHATYDVHSR